MFKIYDRGADRGAYRYHVIAPANAYREGDAVETTAGLRTITAIGPKAFADPPLRYYYVDHIDLHAPTSLTREQELRRENRRLKAKYEPDPENRARQIAWGEKLRAGKARKALGRKLKPE